MSLPVAFITVSQNYENHKDELMDVNQKVSMFWLLLHNIWLQKRKNQALYAVQINDIALENGHHNRMPLFEGVSFCE